MNHATRHSRSCRAFTMIEASVSVAIVGILLVVALNTVGASTANQFRSAQNATADQLAQGLLDDILQLPFEEPKSTPLFGRESGESAFSKTNYDDVDDFIGWSESPPQDRASTPMAELTGWTRSVIVEWVLTAAPTTISLSDTGLKRITVTVSRNGIPLSTRAGLKGRHS